MNRRVYHKILHEFERALTDAIRIYLSRPQRENFQEISLDLIKISALMLLSFQLDKGIVKIGKENRIKQITLEENGHEINKFIIFSGEIRWIYKKKNIDTEIEQNIAITFDLTNIDKKRIPYKIEF